MDRYFKQITPEVNSIYWHVSDDNTQMIREADTWSVTSGDTSAENIEEMDNVEEINQSEFNTYMTERVGSRPAHRPPAT